MRVKKQMNKRCPIRAWDMKVRCQLFSSMELEERFKIYFCSWPAVVDRAVAINDNIQVDSIIHFKTRHMKTTYTKTANS